LHQYDNNYQFYVVGSSPTAEVQALEKLPGIKVTGRVEDIRSYIKYAAISVAPLRIARGIQNKVLEAMAMNKVVIATQNAMEGIKMYADLTENIQDTVQGQVKRIRQLVKSENLEQMGKSSADWVKTQYQWKTVLAPLKDLL